MVHCVISASTSQSLHKDSCGLLNYRTQDLSLSLTTGSIRNNYINLLATNLSAVIKIQDFYNIYIDKKRIIWSLNKVVYKNPISQQHKPTRMSSGNFGRYKPGHLHLGFPVFTTKFINLKSYKARRQYSYKTLLLGL